MRIAVVGGTGLAGRHTVAAVRRAGHEAVVIARSLGMDVTTGAGLPEALVGVQAVIDTTNTPSARAEQTRAFFTAATTTLLAAELRAGVEHHVVLSVVGIDRVPGNAHYAGKGRQEALALNGAVPTTIVRATQFHEFAEMVVGITLQGNEAVVPPLLVQPVAVADVADYLVAVACGPPRDGVLEMAGPETQDLVDMARRTLTARGESLNLIPSWRGPFGPDMAGEVLLPGPDAHLGTTTFGRWLESLASRHAP